MSEPGGLPTTSASSQEGDFSGPKWEQCQRKYNELVAFCLEREKALEKKGRYLHSLKDILDRKKDQPILSVEAKRQLDLECKNGEEEQISHRETLQEARDILNELKSFFESATSGGRPQVDLSDVSAKLQQAEDSLWSMMTSKNKIIADGMRACEQCRKETLLWGLSICLGSASIGTGIAYQLASVKSHVMLYVSIVLAVLTLASFVFSSAVTHKRRGRQHLFRQMRPVRDEAQSLSDSACQSKK